MLLIQYLWDYSDMADPTTIQLWIPLAISTATTLVGVILGTSRITAKVIGYLDKRLQAYVVKTEHDKECVRNQQEIKDKLERIEKGNAQIVTDMKANEDRSAKTRHVMLADIAKLGTEMAIMGERTKNLGEQVHGITLKMDGIPHRPLP